ncbi:uncharacterized protein A4U43_C05F20400 [Asparagus officinalis]|uniref:Glycosyltransferase 61 catalytic domain-containing protein n=1 Tax=Asparagus officinalis TaxID=4686 RepID=A0A5P1EXG4_ASPOF|nr:EGF domain-specific O-linked N-acetylglucosamine transferase-like [Asparagus officinalis]ONK69201.1 uncharacterized protein A4U43_C05F20400 [Asparagus officinalis]
MPLQEIKTLSPLFFFFWFYLLIERNKEMAHHSSKLKSLPLSQFEIQPRKYILFRYCLLLLLMLSAATSVLKLATSSASRSPLVQKVDDTPFSETSKDKEFLRTHVSSPENHLQAREEGRISPSSCSNLIDGITTSSTANDQGILCCDRSHQRTDVCYMKGDIRTDAQSSSILLHSTKDGNINDEKIRPYTRKWETEVMNTVDEITLHPTPITNESKCDINHSVPAIVFSTGGYTGNVYHEFNDGLIPLYITAERFKGEVVFVVLEYHSWWKTKYGSVVKKLSNYKMVDFSSDRRVHCFSEMMVGLKIHGELTIDPTLMHGGKGIQDFQSLLHQGFSSHQPIQLQPQKPRPKLAIFIRNKSRVLQNLKVIVKICEKIGFDVQILNPKRITPLSEIYTVLNSSDAMLAVHGAAMTHFLFMRPGSVLIQIVPLGLDWAAEAYYGEPAKKLGLNYNVYKLNPAESSLYKQYDRRSLVIRDPESITSKGWSETKRIYLEQQNVRVNLRKFSRLIAKVHYDIVHRLHAQS